MTRLHARNAPSDAERWLACAGSLNLTRKIRESRSSRYAAEGTAAHHIRQDALELGLDAHHFIGQWIFADGYLFQWEDEDADLLQPGIDRVREFEGEMFIEHQVNTTPYVGRDEHGREQFGTLDVGIIGSKLIVINDLKYGTGIPVSPVENKQLQLYALSFWREVAKDKTDADEFLIIVDQPRNSGGGGEWRISLDDLLKFGDFVRERAEMTRDPDAPRTPSAKACQWCPASKIDGMCPEFEAWNLSMVGLTFDNLDELDEMGLSPKPRDPQGLTPERRSFIVRNWPVFQKWYERLHADALADALVGDPVPGLKAVAGRRGKRFWTDDEAAEQFLAKRFLHDQIVTQKLISPAQAEKLTGKGNLPRALVEQGTPKPILVPEQDERPALRSFTFDNFENGPTNDGEDDA